MVDGNDEGKWQQVSCVAKHQSREAREDRNYLDRKGQPGLSSHDHMKRSPPCGTVGNLEASREAADPQGTSRQKAVDRQETTEQRRTGQNVPEERKVSEVEAEPEEPEEERQVQQHEEARAASSGSRAQSGPKCHSGNKSHSSAAEGRPRTIRRCWRRRRTSSREHREG